MFPGWGLTSFFRRIQKDNFPAKNFFTSGLQMPTTCPNVASEILNPRNTWENKEAYDAKANELANSFNKNFEQFAEYANAEILAAAPKAAMSV